MPVSSAPRQTKAASAGSRQRSGAPSGSSRSLDITRTPPARRRATRPPAHDEAARRGAPSMRAAVGPCRSRVEDPDAAARAREGGGEPGGDEALADAALAAHHGDDVPHRGEPRRDARPLGLDLRGQGRPFVRLELVVGADAPHLRLRSRRPAGRPDHHDRRPRPRPRSTRRPRRAARRGVGRRRGAEAPVVPGAGHGTAGRGVDVRFRRDRRRVRVRAAVARRGSAPADVEERDGLARGEDAAAAPGCSIFDAHDQEARRDAASPPVAGHGLAAQGVERRCGGSPSKHVEQGESRQSTSAGWA